MTSHADPEWRGAGPREHAQSHERQPKRRSPNPEDGIRHDRVVPKRGPATITAMLRADAAIQASGQKIDATFFSADELSSFGMDLHAGVGETSGMLAIRPDLVSPTQKALPRQVGHSLDEIRNIT
jgi:hypothetical protein